MINQVTHRMMKDPTKWIGRRLPKNLDIGNFWWDFDNCDDCQCFWPVWDSFYRQGLHTFLYPECDEDWELQEKLHIEESQSFCPACLKEIENKANEIDPEWQKRMGL